MYAAGVPASLSLYNKDSLSITDQDGVKLNLLSSVQVDPNDNTRLYYVFGITPIYKAQTDIAAFTQEISKEFYIQYNSTERDTLTCTFKANKNNCNSYFEYLKVFYKNIIIGSSNSITCDVRVNKL